jgi:hypothetical protein
VAVADGAGPNEQIEQLRDYFAQELPPSDARFCFRWLAACALYPVLRWPLTSRFGHALAAEEGRAPPNEDLFLVLARLPWFRTGRMPGEVRHALAATLDAADRKTTQAALVDALGSALSEPGTAAVPHSRASGHLARLVARLPDGELSDPLLATGLRGWRAGGLRARLAAMQPRLPPKLRHWFEAPKLIALAAAIAAAGASYWGYSQAEKMLARQRTDQPVTAEVVNIWLAACNGPAQNWGAPSFRNGPLRLRAPIRLLRVSAGPGFASAVLAPDLSAALTTDRKSETLWSLQGDGARTYAGGPEPLTLGRGRGGMFLASDEAGNWTLDPRRGVKQRLPDSSSGEMPARPPSEISLSSREGVALTARIEGAQVVVANARTGVPIARIGAMDSPLLGLGVTSAGKLAVARCDPKGRIVRVTVAIAPPVSTPTPQPTPAGPGQDRPLSPGPLPATPPQQTYTPPSEPPRQQQAPLPQGTVAQCSVTADVLSCTAPIGVAQVRPAPKGRGETAVIAGIVLHDTDGPAVSNAPSLGILTKGRPDLPGPLAHILIGRDGSAYQITSFRQWISHIGRAAPWLGVELANRNTIAVYIESDGKGFYPEAQLASARAIVRALMAAYGTRIVVGHKEVAIPRGRKRDPALDMEAFREQVDACTAANCAPAP